MSLRYTAAASMEEPALVDIERNEHTQRLDRWKDKIEVRLDNRQVFFLFFGSAVVACMLFVLGVIVGKRIESRGRAEAPEISDPLAVLDRAGQPPAAASAPAPAQEPTFPAKLIAGPSKGRAPAPLPPKPAAPVVAKVQPAPPPKPAALPAAKPAEAAPKAPAAPKPGKFTLHLGTFPTKDEADALAKKFAAQGAFVVAAEVPEKGTVYRVRSGSYANFADATAAKSAFEKQTKAIALVASK
jgi:DedD protein